MSIHSKYDWRYGNNSTINIGSKDKTGEYKKGVDKDGLDPLDRHIIEEIKDLHTYGGFEDTTKEVWEE